MDSNGNIRKLAAREELGHDEVEVPEHHVEILVKMGTKARKEYFRAVKQGLGSITALACAEGVERATKVPELSTDELVAEAKAKRLRVEDSGRMSMQERRALAAKMLGLKG